jgi:F-type H+-transporting ATPase subunit gamma
MGSNLRDIKRRITSVKSTQKITRAMKMVAAAKLRRAQEAILQARPYAHRLDSLIDHLVPRVHESAHTLLQASENGPVVLLVVTSDRGLCGGFNSSLVMAAMEALNGRFADREVEIIVIGRKGVDLLSRRACTIRDRMTGIFDGDTMECAERIIDGLVKDFVKGSISEVHCLYNEFKSALVQTVTTEQLLPFEKKTVEEENTTEYLYEPSESHVLQQVLIHGLYIQMHRILFESAASEHGARMTAMESATNNAGDMIDRLTLQYNRARQDTITSEMIEIIGGAEAI